MNSLLQWEEKQYESAIILYDCLWVISLSQADKLYQG